jgi:hypothetical protein
MVGGRGEGMDTNYRNRWWYLWQSHRDSRCRCAVEKKDVIYVEICDEANLLGRTTPAYSKFATIVTIYVDRWRKHTNLCRLYGVLLTSFGIIFCDFRRKRISGSLQYLISIVHHKAGIIFGWLDSRIASLPSKIDQLPVFFFLRYPVLSIATKSRFGLDSPMAG